MSNLKVNSGGARNLNLKVSKYLIAIIIYSFLVTGGTYAYLTLEAFNNSISGMGGCSIVNYRANEIHATDLLSTVNYEEGASTTITLSQSADCEIYTSASIYLHTNNTTTAPIETVPALKYKIITEDNIEYNGTITKKGDVLLATVPLTTTEKTYTIYLWIDSNISLGQYNNVTYSGYIYATSIQTSTIGDDYSDTETLALETINFSYIGASQNIVIPKTGNYKIELWGAQGGSNEKSIGGYGGYTAGTISLTKNISLSLYVGEEGKMQEKTNSPNLPQTFNGGGISTSNTGGILGSGGGSTDVRLLSGNWNDFNSLKSRIMVAAGGGAGCDYSYNDTSYVSNGASAGGLIGYDGIIIVYQSDKYVDHLPPQGGLQIKGGSNVFSNTGTYGKFGYAGTTTHSSSGGGSGYYGGQGGIDAGWSPSGGGGGSSFISGHNGCDAILESSTEDNIVHSNQSVHYSGYQFTNTIMIDGSGYNWTTERGEQVGMFTHDGTSTMIGNQGNGYAKITKLP